MVSLDHSIERAAAASVIAIWNRKLLIVLTSVAVFCGATLLILSLRPVYQGSALLLSGQLNLEQSVSGARPSYESAIALTRIAQSDEVIRAAVNEVGLAHFSHAAAASGSSAIGQLRTLLFGPDADPPPSATAIDSALMTAKSRLSVRSETNSNVVEVNFLDKDSAFAARFANAVAHAFVDRQNVLNARPGAVEFFRSQRQRFDDELAHASAALEKFSIDNGFYAIDQQRELLLRRLSELDAEIAANKSLVSEMTGRRLALAEQMQSISPVAQSPYIASVLDAVLSEHSAGARPSGGRGNERGPGQPLLMVQVYQDSVVSLLKLNTEIIGGQNRRKEQEEEQARLTAELNLLSRRAEQFDRLQRAVAEAARNSELYAKRTVEEQVDAELRAARFSTLRVLQHASPTTRPAFPNYKLMLPAAAIFSLAVGVGLALLFRRTA